MMTMQAFTPRTMILTMTVLFLSATLQLATSWIYHKYRPVTECSCSSSLPSSPNFETSYSWIGDDYPPYLPIDLGDPVALVLEDSRHYALTSPEADAEWESVYPGRGLGFVRLGPKKRFFSLSLYHQMHCLDSLRRTILGQSHHHGKRGNGEGPAESWKRDVEHSAHCLNYLRQTALCAADMTLEPEVVEGSQEVGEGLGATHVCRDWSKVHEFVKRNWEDWEEWQQTNSSLYES